MYEEEQELFTLRRPLDLPASFQVSAFTPGAIAEVLSETRLGRTGAAIIATTSEVRRALPPQPTKIQPDVRELI